MWKDMYINHGSFSDLLMPILENVIEKYKEQVTTGVSPICHVLSYEKFQNSKKTTSLWWMTDEAPLKTFNLPP